MHLKYTVSHGEYRRFIWKDLLFEHVWNPLILLAYAALWKVTFLLAQYGMLKRNLPVLILLVLFFLGVLMEFLFRGDKRIQERVTSEGDLLYFTSIEVFIMEKDGDVKNCIPWKDLKRLKENKRWVFLYFTGRRFIPVEKACIQESIKGELRQLLESKKHIRKISLRWTVLILWVLITLFGIYSVGKSAISYNGKLSWKIEEWKRVRTVSLGSDNIYELRLEGMMDNIERRIEVSPHLVAKSYSVHFRKDGTMETIDLFLYGFDGNYKPHRNYLIWYDSKKSRNLYVKIQNLDGAEEAGGNYQQESDFSLLKDMMEMIPIQEDTESWTGEEFQLQYEGYENWEGDANGVLLMEEDGTITEASSYAGEAEGISLSVFCTDKNETASRYYVYKQ